MFGGRGIVVMDIMKINVKNVNMTRKHVYENMIRC